MTLAWAASVVLGAVLAMAVIFVILVGFRPRRVLRALVNAHLEAVALFLFVVVLVAEEYHRLRKVPLKDHFGGPE